MLNIFVYLILTLTELYDKYYYYLCSTDEQTKVESSLYKAEPDSLAPEPKLYSH